LCVRTSFYVVCHVFLDFLLISFRCSLLLLSSTFFFFNDTATTEIYTLSLHDALPISLSRSRCGRGTRAARGCAPDPGERHTVARSEEHTSELQSRSDLVCRLLLEKKKKKNITLYIT